ncbi:hypothetical protein M0812_03491 [Anaeramoeba flamelloides]|uniref:Uncharacterized protein n=1 Tax=Anaeramoeba flamelloides TaxID=1746091 RepID=A0AAV8AC62_9EUKA|nr:hypothetical protein M0812_03491 [Anaeramoeba flamelloides]
MVNWRLAKVFLFGGGSNDHFIETYPWWVYLGDYFSRFLEIFSECISPIYEFSESLTLPIPPIAVFLILITAIFVLVVLIFVFTVDKILNLFRSKKAKKIPTVLIFDSLKRRLFPLLKYNEVAKKKPVNETEIEGTFKIAPGILNYSTDEEKKKFNPKQQFHFVDCPTNMYDGVSTFLPIVSKIIFVVNTSVLNSPNPFQQLIYTLQQTIIKKKDPKICVMVDEGENHLDAIQKRLFNELKARSKRMKKKQNEQEKKDLQKKAEMISFEYCDLKKPDYTPILNFIYH